MLRVSLIKKALTILILISVLSSVADPVDSAVANDDNTHIPYEGYTYNRWNSINSPNGYAYTGAVTGMELGIGDFSSPTDMYERSGELYIMDSGNDRIVVLDAEMELVRIVYPPVKEAAGIFVKADGTILIADPGYNRVIACDPEGSLLFELQRPDYDVFPDNLEFRPVDVVVDRADNIYVLIRGFFYGAAIYDNYGQFSGFYGANRVTVTATMLWNRFWRRVMTEQQVGYIARYVPTEFTSFDIDDTDFIYTVTRQKQLSGNQIRKMNPMGKDILPLGAATSFYGDSEQAMHRGELVASSFVDIVVDDYGFINGLDQNAGRVFQYDQESHLLLIFGGRGNQAGLFASPIAIESMGHDILVLDDSKNNITVFSPTVFGEYVREAVGLYNDGLYTEAVEPWYEVLRMDSGYEMAYVGIGKAYFMNREYAAALPYLKLGQDRRTYSEAFSYVRAEIIAKYFPLVATIVALLILWIFFRGQINSWYRKRFPKPERQKRYDSPFYYIFHPFDGIEALWHSSSLWVLTQSIVIITFWFLVAIFEYQGTGFIFNVNRPNSLQVGYLFVRTFGITFLFSTLNWAVSALLDGSGTLRRIWIITSYSLLPYICAIFLRALLSNVILQDEMVFVDMILYAAIGWSLLLLYIGLKEVHEYSGKQTVGNMLLTVAGIAVAMFIFILFGSLVQELISFAVGIYSEMSFRLI